MFNEIWIESIVIFLEEKHLKMLSVRCRPFCLGAIVLNYLTHWSLGDLNVILKMQFSVLFYWLVSSDLLMIMPSDECHRALLMISQDWFS